MQNPSGNTLLFSRTKDPPDPKILMLVRCAVTPKRSTGKRKERHPTTPQTPTGSQRRSKIHKPGAQIEPLQFTDTDADMDSDEDTDTPTTIQPTTTTETVVLAQMKMIIGSLRQFSDHHNWKPETLQLAYAITSKFHPELLEQSGTESPPNNVADSGVSQQGDTETRKAIADLTKAVHSLNERMGDTPSPVPGKNNTSTSTNPQGVKTVLASGPVYKPAKNPSKVSPSPAAPRPPPLKSPLDSHHPARLIVLSRDGSLKPSHLSERQAVTYINDRLALHDSSKHLRVASARYNHRSNLILMTREDQTGAELKSHAQKYIDILLPADALPDAIELLTDDKRYMVRVNGIWTGRENGHLHTPKEIADELTLNNPVIGKVTPSGLPKWMKAEVDLREQEYSSVVLEFKSEDDAKALLATKYLAAFARFCEVVQHADKPPVLQCGNCWGFGHHAGCCKARTKCRICASDHAEKDHHFDIIMGEDGPVAPRQTYNCSNCGNTHPATDRRCPDRIRAAGGAKGKDAKNTTGGGKTRVPRKKLNKTAGATAVPPLGEGDIERRTGDETTPQGEEKEMDDEGARGAEWSMTKLKKKVPGPHTVPTELSQHTQAPANQFAALQEEISGTPMDDDTSPEDSTSGSVPI